MIDRSTQATGGNRSPDTIGRITMDAGVLGGKPCVAGTRISVELILEELASGLSIDQLIEAYPHLRREDIQAALHHALDSVRHEEVGPLPDAKT